MHRRLAGRVSAAHDRNDAFAERARVSGRGAVEDAAAHEVTDALRHQATVIETEAQHDSFGEVGLLVVGHHQLPLAILDDAHDVLRAQDVGVEAARLGDAPSHQFVTADRCGEPGVVLDGRTLAGLAAELCRGVEKTHVEPLGRAADGSAEACGPTSHDEEVEFTCRHRCPR